MHVSSNRPVSEDEKADDVCSRRHLCCDTPVVTSWAVAGQQVVFLHMYLQTRVTLEAFPVATPRGRSSSSHEGELFYFYHFDSILDSFVSFHKILGLITDLLLIMELTLLFKSLGSVFYFIHLSIYPSRQKDCVTLKTGGMMLKTAFASHE